jgi:kynurenine formamidase
MTAVFDLSHPIGVDSPMFPGHPGPDLEDYLSREASRANYAGGTSFVIHRYRFLGNTGTYLDAPFHRHAAGDDLAALPLTRTVDLPGMVLDVRDAVAAGRLGVAPEDLLALQEPLTGKAVLLCSGWARRWSEPSDHYLDPAKPFLSGEGAEALLAAGVALVGIDTWNVDDVADGTRPAHTILLAAGIPIVENLRGLDQLVGRPFRFFAAPLPFVGGSAIPVRAFALTTDD